LQDAPARQLKLGGIWRAVLTFLLIEPWQSSIGFQMGSDDQRVIDTLNLNDYIRMESEMS